MKCKDCNHFCQTHIGSRGSIHGSCKLKCSASYTDTRLGRRNACKHFEVREALQTEPCEDADLISRDYVKEHLTACFENGREFHSPDLAEVLQMIDDVPSVNPTCAKMEQVEDCVSRQAVLDEIETVCFSDKWREFRINNGSNGERDYIIKFIKQMPPVQSEQKVVRCKDCKHLYQDGECPLRLWKYHVEDDFCSYAERKMEDWQLPSVQPELNCRNCVFRMGYGTGIDEGVLNALTKKMEEGE